MMSSAFKKLFPKGFSYFPHHNMSETFSQYFA